MGFWDAKECVSLFWRRDGLVVGTRVVKGGDGFLEVAENSSASFEKGGGLAAVLAAVETRLLTSSTDILIVGGDFDDECVCFDLNIPNMPEGDMRQAIKYELSRLLPCESGDVVFGFRKLAPKNNNSKASRFPVRIFAVSRKVWSELLTDFTSAGFRFDALAHPCMLLDPLLSEFDEFNLPGDESSYRFSMVGDGPNRQMRPMKSSDERGVENSLDLAVAMGYEKTKLSAAIGNGELDSFIPGMLQAAYALSSNFAADKRCFIPLPRELRFERFKRSRLIFFALLFLIVVLSCVLTVREWWDDWSRLAALNAENTKVERRISELKVENAELARFEKSVVLKIAGANPGIHEITGCLYELTKIIPKDVWLLNFSARGSSLDISLRAPKGKRVEIMKAVNESKLFKVKNSNTRRGSDGSESVYLHLEMTTGALEKAR